MPDRKSLLSNVIKKVESSGLASKNTIDIAKKQTSSSSGSSGSKKKNSSSKQVAKKKVVNSGVLPESTKEKIKSDVMVEEEASVKDEVVSGPASAAVQKKVTSSGVLPESTVEQVKPIVSRSVMAKSPPSTPVGVKKVSSDVMVKEKTEYGLNEFYQKPYVMQRELSDQRKNIREGVAFWKPKADILPDSIKYDIGSATAGVYSGYDIKLKDTEKKVQGLASYVQEFRKWDPDTKIVEEKEYRSLLFPVVSRLENRGVVDPARADKIRNMIKKKSFVKSSFYPDFPYAGAHKYSYYKMRLSQQDIFTAVGVGLTGLTGEDPLGLKSAYYWATGNEKKALETKIQAIQGTKDKDFFSFYLSSPMGVIGTSYAGSFGFGTGIGALSAISKPVGGIVGAEIGIQLVRKTYRHIVPIVSTSIETGDYGDLIGTGTNLSLGLASGITGFKSGYNLGYGYTEAFLYNRATYEPGSADYIRFKNTFKTVRKLRFINSDKQTPLDFTKDIMRLDSNTAKLVIKYLKSNPKTVIGGSASQYTQVYKNLWNKYRDINPRDIDLLVKNVKSAKQFIGGKSHQVDIHGFDMGGRAGIRIRFCFESQKPIRIGDYKYMRLGEQLIRKGTSSIMKESSFRWFKDIPDFKMVAEQLIISGKKSYNPLNWFRAGSASKNLNLVLNPKLSSSFGKPSGFISRYLSGFAKRVYKPDIVDISASGSYPGIYSYPAYPVINYIPAINFKTINYVPTEYISNIKIPSLNYQKIYDIKQNTSNIFKPSSKKYNFEKPNKTYNYILDKPIKKINKSYIPETTKKYTSIKPNKKYTSYQPVKSQKYVPVKPSEKYTSYQPVKNNVLNYQHQNYDYKKNIFTYSPPPPKKRRKEFDSVGKTQKKPDGAFNVFVKDRVYVKGKKRYAERFIKVNKKPLSRGDALSMGGDVVDNSAAATFKIRRTGGKPQKPGFRSPSWDYLGGKFDARKNNLFVEPSRFRIDSRGEIKGISALGWVAEKRKKARRTRVKPVVSKKSIRMIGGDVVMDNDISKLIRRYGF